MIKDGQNIESLFNKAFDGAQEMPPESVWSNLEKQLDEASIDGLFKTNFENASIEPPLGMWAKIQQGLWMKDFMRFTPNRINIYYTSLIAVMAGVGLFMSNTKPSNKPTQTITSQSRELIIPKTNKNLVQSIKNNISNTSSLIVQSKTKPTQNRDQKKSNIITPSSTSNQTIPLNTGSMAMGQYIIGDSVICIATDRTYEIKGDLSNIDIKWIINPKTVTIEKISNNRITLNSDKAGIITLDVELSNANNKRTIQYQVKVIEAARPVILGSATVCEGSQSQFKTGSLKFISKMYSWDVSVNKYSNLSANVILVDCKTSGYDTIRLRDISLKTGCNNTAILPIIIFPKPEADFKIIDNGNGVVDFQNTSKCGQKSINCKQLIKWNINDQGFTKNNITVEFGENGLYTANLEVQTEFGCKETIKKDFTISLQTLFIPNAFKPINEDDVFIPKGENLASYTLEIFDATNKKLWESTQLVDGRPAEGWDGKVDGQLMPVGTYFWKIIASFKDGTKWKGQNQKGKNQNFGTFVLIHK